MESSKTKRSGISTWWIVGGIVAVGATLTVVGYLLVTGHKSPPGPGPNPPNPGPNPPKPSGPPQAWFGLNDGSNKMRYLVARKPPDPSYGDLWVGLDYPSAAEIADPTSYSFYLDVNNHLKHTKTGRYVQLYPNLLPIPDTPYYGGYFQLTEEPTKGTDTGIRPGMFTYDGFPDPNVKAGTPLIMTSATNVNLNWNADSTTAGDWTNLRGSGYYGGLFLAYVENYNGAPATWNVITQPPK